MKKVLFLMNDLSGGGAEKVLVDLLNHIDTKKFDITLVLLEKKGIYINSLNKNIKVKYLSGSNSLIDRIYRRLIQYKWIKYFPKSFYKYHIKNQYDVEIAFLEGWTTKLINYSTNKNSKKIAWVHIDLLKKHWTKKMYKENEELICYNNLDEIIFVSSDSKNSFEKLYKDCNTNKKIIYNPIIIPEIEKKSEEIDVKFDDTTIISVGRLCTQKGYDRLIKAHANIVKDYPHKLVILGEGDQRNILENLILELNVQNSVELKGFIKNPYPYIKASDIFISSSITEGYPLVVCESIVLEKPIICTDITGPREILNNGEYGVLCENSVDGITLALKNILSDPSEIYNYTIKSKERKKQFDYKSIIEEIENIIK